MVNKRNQFLDNYCHLGFPVVADEAREALNDLIEGEIRKALKAKRKAIRKLRREYPTAPVQYSYNEAVEDCLQILKK